MAEVAEVAEVKPCSDPGCDQPRTKSCSACKTAAYCCISCQKADWPKHKEECDGHLRKVGIANLEKAKGFEQKQNWVQALRYGEIATTKLTKLKDRRLETVKLINDALTMKYNAYGMMGRYKEAKECAEENYTLWAMNHIRNPSSMEAALALVQSCLHNGEHEDAEHYARHAMFMINDMNDNFIPSEQRSQFVADGSYYLARAIFHLTQAGGIPPEGKQKSGEEAIELSRQALKIHTQLHGTESPFVAREMCSLAEVLDYFNDVDDNEVLRLHEQARSLARRVEGSLSPNMAASEGKSGRAYSNRARRANNANDLDRCLDNLEMALPHYREAARICRVINHVDSADLHLQDVAQVEEKIKTIRMIKAVEAASKK